MAKQAGKTVTPPAAPMGAEPEFTELKLTGLDLTGLKLDHLAIATPDLDAGSAPYLALGLRPEGPDEDVEAQGVRVRTFMVGESLIELLMPTRLDSPIAAFLTKRGAGLHHLAFGVTNLGAQMQRLEAQGAAFLGPAGPGRAGTRVAFLHPRWGGGTLIELVEHPAGSGH